MSLGRRPSIAFAGTLIVLAGLVAYSGSLSGPFIFDDLPTIVGNTTLRHLSQVFSPQVAGSTVGGRPVLNATFAINYALGGTSTRGYHLVNLAIHLLAALTIFGISRRTLERKEPGEGTGSARLVALAIALIWTVHPLQTESVTYVVQRAESLMGLFYLLTLYGFVRGSESEGSESKRWYCVSIGACLLGVGAKEVIVSAPLIVLLYDRAFVSGTFAGAWRARKGYYLALAASWILLGYFVVSTGGNRGGSMGFGLPIAWPSYELTQFRAIAHYLKLVLWPAGLAFNYEPFSVTSLTEILPSALLVLAVLAVAIWALWTRPALGFLGAWFFAILAPTSLVPAVNQMIAEHRMYLPLAAVVAIGVLALERLFRSRPVMWMGIAALAVASCMGATLARNRVYQSELSIWGDAVAKRPKNPVALEAFGNALIRSGRNSEAIDCFEKALQLRPAYSEGHENLGNAFAESGQTERAIPEFKEAARLAPDAEGPHRNLGLALKKLGQLPGAATELERASRLEPGNASIRFSLGDVVDDLGRHDEAITHYKEAIAIDPDYADAHYNLAIVLQGAGRMPEAEAQFKETLRIRPADAVARNNLAVVMAQTGRMEESVAEFRKAIASNSSYIPAHNNLGLALQALGRTSEARAEFDEAARLQARVRL